ncbi:PH domain-containing protein [Paenibacillus sp. P25]|nr:PH domain-containing protein [Paenibacillus sp. P25]
MRRSEHEPMTSGRRLHPVSMIYFILRSGKELSGLLPLIPVCILLGDRLLGQDISRFLLTALIIGAAAILLITFAWLRWRRFMYRVEQGLLYIEHGLWVRKKLWIPRERIQSMNTTLSLYDRIFGLIRLEVETAGGDGKPEAVLSSISAAEAARIQEALGFTIASAASGPILSQTEGNVPEKLSMKVAVRPCACSQYVDRQVRGHLAGIGRHRIESLGRVAEGQRVMGTNV